MIFRRKKLKTNLIYKNKTSFGFFNRVKTKVVIFQDKYLNQETILKSIIGAFIVFGVIFVLLTTLLFVSFRAKIKTTDVDLPNEYKTLVIYLDMETINNYKWRTILDQANKLVRDQKLNKVYIYTEGYDDEMMRYITKNFDKNITFLDDFFPDSPKLAGRLKDKYQLDKVILISSNSRYVRLMYGFQKVNLLVIPIKVDPDSYVFNFSEFFKLSLDILNFNL